MAEAKQGQKERKLTPRQRAFVVEYLRCWNASEAYRRMGGKGKNANVISARMLANVGIREAIDRCLAERAMSANEVLDRLTEHGRGVWGDYIKEDGSVDIKQMVADGKGYLIRETEVTRRTYKDGSTEVTGKVKFPDSQTALVQMGRHYRLFNDRTELTGADGGPIETKDVSLTDDERSTRIAAILDAARARRDRQAADHPE